MEELQGDLPTLLMDGIGEFLQTRYQFILVNPQFKGKSLAAGMHVGGLRNDQAYTPPGSRPVVGHQPVSHRAILLAVVGHHGGHDETVFHFHRPYSDWLEQPIVRTHFQTSFCWLLVSQKSPN